MTKELKLALLGFPQVRLGEDVQLHFSTNKTRALLFYLAVTGEPHTRDGLAALFWRDMPDQQAKSNLRAALPNLRKTAGDYLLITRESVAFNHESAYWLDVEHFRAAMTADPQVDNVQRLREAIELYRGDFLDEFHVRDAPAFEEWALSQREQLHVLAIQGFERPINVSLEQDDHEAGLTFSQRLLALEPWRESAHQQRMLLLARSGQRVAALAQYEICRRILMDEFGIEPSAESRALYEQIKSDKVTTVEQNQSFTPSLSPPVADSFPAPDPYRTLSYLDPYLDQKLFGVAEIKSRLKEAVLTEERPWLIALEGMGGIGKTTLANDFVHQLVNGERFHNIAWVSAKQEEFLPEVGLQALDRPALDAGTLTDMLLEQLNTRSVLSMTSSEKRTALLRLLKERAYLVVVDNLETVSDYEALLPLLRQAANPTKFLLMSRFSLKANADVYSLSLEEFSQADAFAFLRYEAAMRGMDSLQNASETQLDTIYAVVGGNPLALKLIIGQLNFLPLSSVLENLQEAQGKQVDELYGYIYWQAWQMLDDDTRILFLVMPVIPRGTFAELAAISQLEAEQLQNALRQLIALSLIQVDGDLEERVYQLHRLTEAFLVNKVLKAQSTSSANHQSKELFHRHICQAVQYWAEHTAVQEINVPILDNKRDNILKAISLGIDLREAWAWPLIRTFASYMERRGHWEAWHGLLTRAIVAAQQTSDLDGEITLTALLGRLCQRQSRTHETIRYYRRVIRLARNAGNRFEEARTCSNLGFLFIDEGSWWRSEVLGCHALATFELLDSDHGRAHTHNHLGVLYTRQGRWEKAEYHYRSACVLWRAMGDQHSLIYGLENLGLLYNDMERFSDAIDYLEEALQYARLSGEGIEIGSIFNNLGIAHRESGDLDAAEMYAKQAKEIFERFASSLRLTRVWGNLGIVYVKRSEWELAVKYLEKSLNGYRTLQNKDGEISVLPHLIECELTRSNLSHAAQWISEFERVIEQNDNLKQPDNDLRKRLEEYCHRLGAV
ncbi:tetratricopeptide repeat protein [Chloroflexi bacterium TSY]|nr:tetratricopeptide repeat protein [Chloroflexi bacterium TSY]